MQEAALSWILFGKGPVGWDGWDNWNSWDQQISIELEAQSG